MFFIKGRFMHQVNVRDVVTCTWINGQLIRKFSVSVNFIFMAVSSMA